jgi:hypothetical protein
MKRYFIIGLFSVISLSGLSGKPPKMTKPKKGEWIEPAKPIEPKNIYGNWIWFETDCCGIRHGISTPESTSDNIELELKKDNSFQELHTKKNTLPRSGSFIMFRENESDMIQFNDERPAKYILSTNGDTLVISWKHLELQTEKYIRKK